MRPHKTLNIAHRGARLLAAENTLEAIRVGFEEGAHGVEFDVQVTADGEPVLFHDDDLKALTGAEGRVHRWRWSDLSRLPVTDRHGHRGQIPHLSEVIELLDGQRGLFNLELKVVEDSARDLVSAVARLMEQVDPEPWVLSSFSRSALDLSALQLPNLRCGALIDDDPGCDFWPIISGDIDLSPYAALHPHGLLAERLSDRELPLNVWTLNHPRHWEMALELGVHGIITDDPGGLARFLSAS